MKYTLNKFDFIDGMREDPYNNFSYHAIELLWDFLTEEEDSNNEETEFDPVDFRGRFSESTIKEIISDYKINVTGLNEEEDKKVVMEFLDNKTIILGETETGTIVYENF
jgi:hypothetical protein